MTAPTHRRRVEILATIRVVAQEMRTHAGEPHAVLRHSEKLLRLVDELEGKDTADRTIAPSHEGR